MVCMAQDEESKESSLEALIKEINETPITFELEDKKYIGFGDRGTYPVLVQYQSMVVQKGGVYRVIKIKLSETRMQQ